MATVSEHETLDLLVGDWSVYQLADGHRFSTDDLVVAWRAVRAQPTARRHLDLGAGVGTVGLVSLYHLRRGRPPAAWPELTSVEAQDVSVGLLRRTLAHNGLADQVRVIHGDLRDRRVLDRRERFDLITGTPPYVPVGTGHVSPHPQKAACRMELRGTLYDYCAAARRHLAPDGRFVFIMWASDPRTEDAPRRHGLQVLERTDVIFREGREPFLAALVCAREEDVPPGHRRRTLSITVRGRDREWTDQYEQFRRRVGMMGHPQGELPDTF